MSIYDVFPRTDPAFGKEEWIRQKQEERKAVYEKIEEACCRMRTDGSALSRYLTVQGWFDRYSVSNAILVSVQNPDATRLKSRSDWKKSGVFVEPDAKGLVILGPGNEYTRKDGTRAVGYQVKEVYDVSETSAKERAGGNRARPMKELVAALIKAGPVPFQVVEEREGPAYYDPSEKIIRVRAGLKEGLLFAAMAKETAVAVFDLMKHESRDTSGFKAYCAAYLLGSRYGADTGSFCFEKLPETWAGLDPKTFKKELASIREVFGEIRQGMDPALTKGRASGRKESGRGREESR